MSCLYTAGRLLLIEPREVLLGIVTLDGLGLDGDDGVAALVEFRTVGHGAYHVAGRESQTTRQCG